VVLYECATWSLTLREGDRLGIFENRVLRRTFGLKRSEVTGGRNTLHNEELCDLYCALSTIRIIKSRRNVTRMGEKRNMYRIFVGKPEGKRLLGRPRRMWRIILGWILER
jgi:hypothetical protein